MHGSYQESHLKSIVLEFNLENSNFFSHVLNFWRVKTLYILTQSLWYAHLFLQSLCAMCLIFSKKVFMCSIGQMLIKIACILFSARLLNRKILLASELSRLQAFFNLSININSKARVGLRLNLRFSIEIEILVLDWVI